MHMLCSFICSSNINIYFVNLVINLTKRVIRRGRILRLKWHFWYRWLCSYLSTFQSSVLLCFVFIIYFYLFIFFVVRGHPYSTYAKCSGFVYLQSPCTQFLWRHPSTNTLAYAMTQPPILPCVRISWMTP